MKWGLLFAALWLSVSVLLVNDLIQGPLDFPYLESPPPPETPDFSGYAEPTLVLEVHYPYPLPETVEHPPHRKTSLHIVVRVCGIEENDWVVVTAIAEHFGWGRVTKRGNGDYVVPMGPSPEDPPSGVWIVTAFAEGYTVEPRRYYVFLMDGIIARPTQDLDFVFRKTG